MAASSWVWVSPATANHVPSDPNCAAGVEAAAVAVALAALLAAQFKLQHLRTATYKRVGFFWGGAARGRTCSEGL